MFSRPTRSLFERRAESVTAKLLDGKRVAREIREEVADRVSGFVAVGGATPCLAAVLVGDDAASEVYVRNKRLACERAGMDSQLHRLPAQASQQQLMTLLERLNADEAVHGILVQLPLPGQLHAESILDAVRTYKDVDCFHPENVGLLMQGRPRFLPCTPYGIQQILHRYEIDVAGKHVVVVGRSEIVGKPLAAMLMQRQSPLGPDSANATVTVCHSRTRDLAELTRQADILVAAIGHPDFITAEMIRPGATVIDVGINRTERGLRGDVAFEEAVEVAGAITPVPGGVGPLTIAMLLANTLAAAELQGGSPVAP